MAGFTALGVKTRVIGISDDHEVEIKKTRIRQLANDTLLELDLDARVLDADVVVISAADNTYGVPDEGIISGIRSWHKQKA